MKRKKESHIFRVQVSMDGLVHGINLFGLFPNITIATRPIYDPSRRIAFLPWYAITGAQPKVARPHVFVQERRFSRAEEAVCAYQGARSVGNASGQQFCDVSRLDDLCSR